MTVEEGLSVSMVLGIGFPEHFENSWLEVFIVDPLSNQLTLPMPS